MKHMNCRELRSIVGALAAAVGILTTAVDLEAKSLSVSPQLTLVTPVDGSGRTKVVATFDVESLSGQTGLRVEQAHLEWTMTGVSADSVPEFLVYEISAVWDPVAVAAGRTGVPIEESYTDSWSIEELDYERNGGFVRLDVTESVRSWVSGETVNRGVVLDITGVGRSTVITQAGDVKLVVRYTRRY